MAGQRKRLGIGLPGSREVAQRHQRLTQHAHGFGMVGLRIEGLAVECGGLGHVAQQREVRHVAGSFRHRAPLVFDAVGAGFVLAFEGVFGGQGVAAGQCSEGGAQLDAFLAGPSLGELARQVSHRATQRVDLVGLQVAL